MVSGWVMEDMFLDICEERFCHGCGIRTRGRRAIAARVMGRRYLDVREVDSQTQLHCSHACLEKVAKHGTAIAQAPLDSDPKARAGHAGTSSGSESSQLFATHDTPQRACSMKVMGARVQPYGGHHTELLEVGRAASMRWRHTVRGLN